MRYVKAGTWIAFATFMFALAVFAATKVYATEKPQIIPPPKTVVVVEKERDYRAAVITALGTYFYMRHRAKKREPLVLERTEPVPPVEPPSCQAERIFQECIAK